jgi:hypothetical protein
MAANADLETSFDVIVVLICVLRSIVNGLALCSIRFAKDLRLAGSPVAFEEFYDLRVALPERA